MFLLFRGVLWGLSWWFRGIRGILPGMGWGRGVFWVVGEFRESLSSPYQYKCWSGTFSFSMKALTLLCFTELICSVGVRQRVQDASREYDGIDVPRLRSGSYAD